MALKVFLGVPDPQGYVGDPIDSFLLYVPLKLFNTDGPQSAASTATVVVPIGSTPSQVCELFYIAAEEHCSALNWPAPNREDVHLISCGVQMPEPAVF